MKYNTVNPMSARKMMESRLISKLMRETFTATLATPIGELPGTAELSESRVEALRKVVSKESDDTITRTYRALSADIVWNYVPIDFGNKDGKVLKKSTSLLKTQKTGHALPMFKDHDRSVEAWIGTVVDAYWDEASNEYPAGINIIAEYDKVALGEVVIRGIKANSLTSVSVTVDFEWSQSHPDMDYWEFYDKLGQEVDGEMVRVLVDRINAYYETSLVWQGADQWAKDRTAASAEVPNTLPAMRSGYSRADLPDYKVTFTTLESDSPADKTNSSKKEVEMREFVKALLLALGLESPPELDTATEGELQTLLDKELDNVKNAIAQTAKAVEDSKTKTAEVEARLAKSEETVKQYVESLHTKLASSVSLTMGESGASSVIALAHKCNVSELEVLVREYETRANELFPLVCNSCGGQKVSRQSSATGTANANSTQKSATASSGKSINELEEEFLSKK